MTDSTEALNRFNTLHSKAKNILDGVSLSGITNDLKETMTAVMRLPTEIQRARGRGYTVQPELEGRAREFVQLWERLSREATSLIETEGFVLRNEARQVEIIIAQSGFAQNNPTELDRLGSLLEREIADAEGKIEESERRIRNHYEPTQNEITQLVEQLTDIHWFLDHLAEATFTLNSGESLVMAATAEWVATGKGKDDPDGILFLTDKRLIFEQKETTGKTLGMFGGKKVQEVKWDVPLSQVEAVSTERKGLLGGKDMITLTLRSGAPLATITLEVKGKAKNTIWAEQIKKQMGS
ncbi:MAG TPA: hypothetical protein PLD47_10655 [Aggregatilineales bacterium]|nr:hypothetical protein [Anaerolineales bacterium]HRE48174.1 hypothetical protein [Aggregatilineales bacterium]